MTSFNFQISHEDFILLNSALTDAAELVEKKGMILFAERAKKIRELRAQIISASKQNQVS